jgi:DNA-binding transcriptional LysR family regulator
LHYFITVAEEQNVGRASRRLRVAQPAVSRQIKNLESELGCTLFSRTPRGMALSSAGEVFLPRARAILRDIAAATLAVRGANAGTVPAKVSDHRR